MRRGPRAHGGKKTQNSLPQPFELDIERLSHDGRGIGTHHGRVVMVSGALPGEKVVVKVEKANAKLWQGRSLSIIEESPTREPALCKHYGRCGSCQIQHLQHDAQISLKEEAITQHLARNNVMVESFEPALKSPPTEYRHRVRLHVNKGAEIGFHEQQGNQVIPIKNCPVMTPKLQEVFATVKADAPLKGLSQIELVVDDEGNTGAKALKGAAEAIHSFYKWVKGQDWSVDANLYYDSGAYKAFAKPSEFTQVNRRINRQMIEQAKRWLQPSPNDRLLDLFCGNGNLSFPFADDVHSILGLEASESSIAQAITSAQENKLSSQFDVQDLFTSDLHQHAAIQRLDPTLVILDPPRAGAERVSGWISKLPSAKRILYISCDPATLARDLGKLSADNWHLRKVGLIDMFPQTRHIETMALLEK